jgi:imidazolonepropionase
VSEERFAVAARRLVTCDPARARPGDPLGVIEDGALVVERGAIVDIGARAEVLARSPGVLVLLDEDGVVTPGLIDAHTHAPWVGSRDAEYAMRMAGADYEAIAAMGGGIAASSRAIREASLAAVVEALKARLRRLAALGVTTVEA